MSLPAAKVRGRSPNPVTMVLSTSLLVALLDAILASMIYVVVLDLITVPRLFQGIAHAVLGQRAFDGGRATVAVGVIIHFCVALTWSTVYYLLWTRWEGLRRFRERKGALAVASIYGPCVWFVMDLVVMPFTQNRVNPPTSGLFWVMAVGHILSVGLPIVLTITPEE